MPTLQHALAAPAAGRHAHRPGEAEERERRMTSTTPAGDGPLSHQVIGVSPRKRRQPGDAPSGDPAIFSAMAAIPGSRFIMTAAHDDVRRGFCVSWVQQASLDPPTVSVAIRKGHDGAPIIRDSRCFGLCQLPMDDRFLWKKFSREDNLCDPFHSLDVRIGSTGVPLIRRARMALECEVALHADWESDHELYIGKVVAVHLFQPELRPDVMQDDAPIGQ
jgi:flavin reductase (DIM6/NTAB) family NADH-FMN oxidoreductase RutF